MKKLLSIFFIGALSTGCVGELLDELQAGLESGKSVVTARDLSKGLSEIHGLSGGIAGMAPSFNKGAGGGLGLAPSNVNLAPGMGPVVDTEYVCTDTETGTWSETKTHPGTREEKEESIYLQWNCRGPSDGPYISSVTAETTYHDGSTSTTSFVESDSLVSDVIDDDVTEGFGRLEVNRYFPEPDERLEMTFLAEVDIQGAFETANLWRYGKFSVKMRNGGSVTSEILPTTPILDGEDWLGTATQVTVHAEGELKTTTGTAVITGVDTGSYTVVNVYDDETTETLSFTSDGTVITISAEGRNGGTRDGSYNLVTGEYAIETVLPAGSLIESVSEDGTWLKGSGEGTYNRMVVHADGKTTVTNVEATVTANTLSATFVHEEDTTDDITSDRLTGSIELTSTPLVKTIAFEMTNGDGDKVVINGNEYPDGRTTLHYTADVAATAVSPDEEGDFVFYADGSGTGTVTKKEEGRSVTVTVTVEADGEVSEEGGLAVNAG